MSADQRKAHGSLQQRKQQFEGQRKRGSAEHRRKEEEEPVCLVQTVRALAWRCRVPQCQEWKGSTTPVTADGWDLLEAYDSASEEEEE